MEAAVARPNKPNKFRRQPSRLQMHAPSSIQVAAPPADVSEWRVAIPLLSPLDIVAIPRIPDEAAAPAAMEAEGVRPSTVGDDGERKGEKKGEEGLRWPGWQHPAAPFYYEPAPGNVPVFLLPNHCS